MPQMNRNVNLEEIDSDALFGIDALKNQTFVQKVVFFGSVIAYLDLPTELSEQMMRLREQATHTTADVHEQDEAYLRRCRENAAFVTEYCGWTRIDCARNGVMRSREEIHDEVMDKLRDLL